MKKNPSKRINGLLKKDQGKLHPAEVLILRRMIRMFLKGGFIWLKT